ncbi:hypothetical protein AU255_03305 [Methyloprofundus sedimenti]|uniref:MalT-like TPR region domain-containing protein n=2 Tax=Methyloprofundus sedimenti TaxID=1420851 RepID=A0A1V8M5U1_9GAMM|nr:hypothetical protein AU255_03305 [Methyloprofundus sedimenti]
MLGVGGSYNNKIQVLRKKMGLFGSIAGKSKVKAANKKVQKARVNDDVAQAEKLLAEAMVIYESIPSGNSAFNDALYNWGMALLYSARLKQNAESVALYQEAGKKFSYCLVAKPDYLGAALDWGVALMELASLQNATDKETNYVLAKEKFTIADNIQEGVASYNFACLHAVHNEFDACKKALERALDYGNLPDKEDILSDADMSIAKTQPWFNDFIVSIDAPESEEDSEQDKKSEKKSKKIVYSNTTVRTDGYKVEYDKKEK